MRRYIIRLFIYYYLLLRYYYCVIYCYYSQLARFLEFKKYAKDTQMHFSATIFHFLETWHGLNAL